MARIYKVGIASQFDRHRVFLFRGMVNSANKA